MVRWAEDGVLLMPLGRSLVAVPPHADQGDPCAHPVRAGTHGRHLPPPSLPYPSRLFRLLGDTGVAVPLVSW